MFVSIRKSEILGAITQCEEHDDYFSFELLSVDFVVNVLNEQMFIVQKKNRNLPGYCTPCKKPSNRKKHFCLSDFGKLVRTIIMD